MYLKYWKSSGIKQLFSHIVLVKQNLKFSNSSGVTSKMISIVNQTKTPGAFNPYTSLVATHYWLENLKQINVYSKSVVLDVVDCLLISQKTGTLLVYISMCVL